MRGTGVSTRGRRKAIPQPWFDVRVTVEVRQQRLTRRPAGLFPTDPCCPRRPSTPGVSDRRPSDRWTGPDPPSRRRRCCSGSTSSGVTRLGASLDAANTPPAPSTIDTPATPPRWAQAGAPSSCRRWWAGPVARHCRSSAPRAGMVARLHGRYRNPLPTTGSPAIHPVSPIIVVWRACAEKV